MAFLLVCLFVVPVNSIQAKDSFLAGYIQTVFNQKMGIGSNEINCLYQSSTGYVWAGTDGGLYRTNGSGFESINLWDTERTDLYTINCLMQDASGRMWIGTDNYGLFYIEGGETFHLQQEYYDGIKSIQDIKQTIDGTLFVATQSGLYTIETVDPESRSDQSSVCMTHYVDEKLASMEFSQLAVLNNDIWAIAGGNRLYVMNNKGSVATIDLSEDVDYDLSCIENVGDEIVVGSTGRNVIVFSAVHKMKTYIAGVDGINAFMKDRDGRLWVCADNGYGYMDRDYNYIPINDSRMDTYISDMIQDYEGNYWVASSRMGLLLLTKGKFVDYNMMTGMSETMVNHVFEYKNKKYVAADDGLYIYNSKNEQIENELTELLKGVSVRHIAADHRGNLWISTYRRYGVVRYGSDKSATYLNRANGLPSMSINMTLPLMNGGLAVATAEGLAIFDKNGEIEKTYGEGTVFANQSILSLYENEKGILCIGTDGAGLYTLNPETSELAQYKKEYGLNSDVVTCLVEGEQGLWVGTDSGLCFYNESFRSISNIEYSNSIYDICIRDGFVWLVGSMGVLRTTEEELLSSNAISGRYYATEDGLTKTVNTTSRACLDKKGILYIGCNEGIETLDTRNLAYNLTAPKIKVTSIEIDGKKYEFDDLKDGLIIKSDTSKIMISFAVFSYINRANLQVEYCLQGFDPEPIKLSGMDVLQAVYTNLDGGIYEFTIHAYNGDGTPCEQPVTFVIEKEKSIFESPVARVGIVISVLLGFILLVFAILRVTKLLRSKTHALEQLSKEHEETVKSSSAKNDYLANMSNEIKTPIHAMMAKADGLLHMVEEDSPYKDEIHGIYDIGNDILVRVDDMILLAKMESGRLEIEESNYAVSDLVADISDYVIDKLTDKSVKFFVEWGDHVVDNLIGDVGKLRSALLRLMDYAIRSTKQGSISLSVDHYEYADREHQDKINLVFTISDTGTGIREERLEHVFDIYNAAEGSKQSSHSSQDVGLAIAKGYADILQADLTVDSIYGAGTSFTMSLDQRPAIKLSSGQMVSKIGDTVSKEDAEKLWLPEVSALLVDDEEVSIEVSKKVLTAFDMKLDVATSGLSAIDMVLNHDYDVVFMDLSMPIMNGKDAMLEIRELSDLKYTMLPIIALDPDAVEENRAANLAAGFTDSLVKPMEFRRVAAILKDCLPENKLQERTDDIRLLIEGSRFQEALSHLAPTIDAQTAIEKIGGSIDVYNKIIQAFYLKNKDIVDTLEERSRKNIRSFKTKIHSIRTLSNSIGAYEFAKHAAQIESSINVGKRDQLRQKLKDFSEDLVNLLLVLEDYLNMAQEVSGLTDEEYAMKREQEKLSAQLEEQKIAEEPVEAEVEETVLDSIEISVLKELREAAKKQDEAGMDLCHEKLAKVTLEGEDKEFMQVLTQAITTRDTQTVQELVNTYIDLRLS